MGLGSPKEIRKNPKNQNSLELGKSGLSNPRLLDLIKNKKRSENETIDRELKGSAWRSPETNVLYSIYCTVQYHAGAVKENKADKADTDTKESLMVDVLKIEIHDNNCMGTNFTPDQKYCSNMTNESQITTKEDKADFSTVVIKANTDGNESEDKFVDIDTEKSLMIDGLGTKAYETDCMGTHLTPAPGQRYITQNMPNENQIADDAYKTEWEPEYSHC